MGITDWVEVKRDPSKPYCFRCREEFNVREPRLKGKDGLRHVRQCAVDVELLPDESSKPAAATGSGGKLADKRVYVTQIFGGLTEEMEEYVNSFRISHEKAALVELSDGRVAIVAEIFGTPLEILAEKIR